MTTRKKRINYNTMAILWIMMVFMIHNFVFSIPVNAQYKTGSPAPDFTLEGSDGKMVQLNHFLNKQQHLILFFADSEEESALTTLDDLIIFLDDYRPRESYQVIAIIKQGQNIEAAIEKLNSLKNETEIPFVILLDEDWTVNEKYEIKNFPTILLLRADLYVRKAYDRFTPRHEASFYQYLKFIFTSQKSKDNSSGCEDGVCPPPPGFE